MTAPSPSTPFNATARSKSSSSRPEAVGERQERLSVVVFSGGRGAASIVDALADHPQVDVTSLVNAYDDGLSTGRVRRLVGGMLGPSDIRKNLITLMPDGERSHRSLKRLLEIRLPADTSRRRGRNIARRLTAPPKGNDEIANHQRQLSVAQANTIAEFADAFLKHEAARHRAGDSFDWGDCAIGNFLFGGGFIVCERDFNRLTQAFSDLCEVRGRVLNVTDGTDLVLTALRSDGEFLRDEASIVSPMPRGTHVDELFLLPDYLDVDDLEALEALDREGRRKWLRQREVFPEPNAEALRALEDADVIVFGPGTQYSSLFPSYLTRGVAEAIIANTTAPKPFVANIVYDHDIEELSVEGLLDSFVYNMSRKGEVSARLTSLVSRLFVQEHAGPLNRGTAQYVAYDHDALRHRTDVTALDFESSGGRHVGGTIVDEILSVVQQAVDIRLEPYRHMVSIIVPALDEARTIETVLADLARLDFSSQRMSKEILVIDGGSRDGTLEKARAFDAVRVYSSPEDGRGSALRHGIDKARGNVIVFFPADGEYQASDIPAVAAPIIANDYRVVFGSRSIKWVLDVDDQLAHIYPNELGRRLSKYGGRALSVLSLVLYNRFVSDPFSTLKAFDRGFLRSLSLDASGVDLEAELIAKSGKAQEFILEVPVSYRPRSKADGKKTTARDGVATLARLVSERFRR